MPLITFSVSFEYGVDVAVRIYRLHANKDNEKSMPLFHHFTKLFATTVLYIMQKCDLFRSRPTLFASTIHPQLTKSQNQVGID